MPRTKRLETEPRKDETTEIIADTIGRVVVTRLTSPRGSRLTITLSLEDDKTRKG